MTHSTSLRKNNFSLTYLDHFKIRYAKEGLNEPSGLALSQNKDSLWTVNDDTQKIFSLNLKGELKKNTSFKIEDKGLEGIVLDPTGEFLYTVKEDNTQIIQFRLKDRKEIHRQSLAETSGYEDIAHFFSDSESNKGLEGIAWNNRTGTLFVMKESNHGLLIELSPDLQTIRSHRLLSGENGFAVSDMDIKDLDFSDLCYDPARDCFWIISDRARRLFLYDWNINQVLQSSKLGYGKKGEYREIKKAEGIAIDPEANRLYVVSDEEARLYVYDIRD